VTRGARARGVLTRGVLTRGAVTRGAGRVTEGREGLTRDAPRWANSGAVRTSRQGRRNRALRRRLMGMMGLPPVVQ